MKRTLFKWKYLNQGRSNFWQIINSRILRNSKKGKNNEFKNTDYVVEYYVKNKYQFS